MPQFDNWRDGDQQVRWLHRGFEPVLWHSGLAALGQSDLLTVFVSMCDAVAGLHEDGILHGALFPFGIWADVELRSWKFADTSLALRIDQADDYLEPLSGLIGTEDFDRLAPEQVDTPSLRRVAVDCYGLGRLFDALASRLNAQLPTNVAEVFAAMQSTDAGARPPFLSAVEGAVSKWSQRGWKMPKTASKRSSSSYPEPAPLKIAMAGRDDVLGALLGQLEKNPSGTAFVVGPPGIGKSTVARLFVESPEVRKLVVLHARAEPARQEQALALWRRLARDLAGKLALLRPEKSDGIRQALRARLGDDLPHLSAAVPELISVLGDAEDPRAAQVSPEAEIRHMLAEAFVESARRLGGIAMVVDDLQWSDQASLASLVELFRIRGDAPLFVCGLSRYLPKTLEEVADTAFRIDLSPVTRTDIGTILERTFPEAIERADELVTQIHLISGGNPLHVSQILHAMISENSLHFDPNFGHWSWNHSRLSSRTLGEDAEDLLSRRIANAPHSVRELLRAATVLEDGFEATTIARVLDLNLESVQRALEQAISLGLLARMATAGTGGYRFVHDQVRQVARQDLTQEAYIALRHTAGLRLLREPPDVRSEHLIAELTKDLDEDGLNPVDRVALGEAILQYAEVSRRRLNFDRAEDLFSRAERLLGRGGGDDRLIRTTVERAYCAHARKRPDEVTRHLTEALSAISDPVRASTLWRVSCVLEAQNENYVESYHHAVSGLLDLGVSMPTTRAGAIATTVTELMRLFLRLGFNPAERIARLRPATGPKEIARIELIRTSLPSAYFVAPELMLAGGLKILRLSVQSGRSPGTAVGAALYGLFVSAFLGRYKLGWQIGEAACRTAAEYANPEIENEVLLIHGHFVQCWADDIRKSRVLFDRGYVLARQTGDTQYANFHILAKIANNSATGVHLPIQQEIIERGISLIRRSNDQFSMRTAEVWQAVANYLARADASDAPAILQMRVESGSARTVSECYRLIKLCQLEWFAGRHESALAAGKAADHLIWQIPGQVPQIEHVLYFGLALARAASEATARHGERRSLARLIRRLRRWAGHSPETFHDILRIIEAEAKACGDSVAVLSALQASSRDFERQDKPYFAALAAESSAWHQSRLGIPGADTAVDRAARLFRSWGADGQARRLEARLVSQTENPGEVSAASKVGTQSLDRMVLQAMQELQSRTSPEDLVSALLETAQAVTGADFVAYITRHANTLHVDMESRKSQSPQPVGSVVDGLGQFPSAVIRFSIATGHEIIGITQNDPRFAEFAASSDPASLFVTCFPLQRSNDVFGLVYIEHQNHDDPKNAMAIDRLRVIVGGLAGMFDRFEMQSKLRHHSQMLATNNSQLLLLEAAKQRYAPFVPEIVRQAIEANPNRSDDSAGRVDVTALILDMEDFTGESARRSPANLARLVQEQFSLLLEPIYDYGGEICNSMGDGLLVIYQNGTPEKHAHAGISSALAMRDVVQTYRRRHKAPILNFGINSGTAIVGLHRFEHHNRRRWFFSATGQVINVAARFADHAKHGQIVIGEETYRRTAGHFKTHCEGSHKLKGLQDPLVIYSVG